MRRRLCGWSEKFLTVTDFGGVNCGIRRVTRRSTGFATNSRGSDAG
jgi:hypothetical protein